MKVPLVVGTLALIFLPARMHSEPLSAHLTNSVHVNLADDLPIQLPIQTDLFQFEKKTDISCFDCYVGAFDDLEPFSISLHQDIEPPSGDFFISFDNCFGPGYGRHRRRTDSEILKGYVDRAAAR
jgi:hypothetical protein